MRCSQSLRARCIVVLLACFALSLVSFSDSEAQDRRELRVGVSGVPAALNPASALEGAVPLIARQVFDTLVTYRVGSTDVDPALATRWAVSRDGLTWSFTLRNGVTFHDGAPLTAAEVASSFTRQLKHDPAAPPTAWAALLRGVPGVIKEVRAADRSTVNIVLVQPYAALLTVLAHPAMSVARLGTAEGVARLVGSGAYRIVDATPGRMAIEAVSGHWSGAPRTERIVFLDVNNDDHAEAEFAARALDIWFPPGPPRRVDGALSTPGLRVGYLAFQTEKEPFSRKKLRQAVAAALDPATLGSALERTAVPLQSFLPPGVWGRREGSPVLGGTREQVRTLLRDGGWPQGATPVMLVPGDASGINATRLAESMTLMLGGSDIPVRVKIEPSDMVQTALENGAHELALAEASVVGGDPHLFLFPLSTSEGARPGPKALNFSFYRNPRLDDVLIRASQLASRQERVRLYKRGQGLLAEDMPWLPIYVRLVWGVARPEVRNLRLHPTGFHRLAPVSLEQ
ncbi:MAG TPA: ABC transporter substrate-binding protein [Methylomirabilota bacterium]